MGRLLIIVVGLAVLAALGAGAVVYRNHDLNASASTVPSDSTVATVVKGDITQSVTSPGIVVSNLDVLVKCQAGGRVLTLPFQESDHVKTGEKLLELDPGPEQRALDLAQITLDSDKSRLVEAKQAEKQAELNLATATEQADANIKAAEVKAKDLRLQANRQQELREQKLASDEDFETADTAASQAETDLASAKIAKEQLQSQAVALDTKKEDIKLAEAQVHADQVSVDLANLNLSYATVTAPMDGVVTQVQVQIGGMVSSALNNAGGGTTILTLSDLSHIFVNASVDESDIGGVRVGQEVQILADSFPHEEFKGKVVQIAAEGVSLNNVVTFLVKIELTSDNKSLLKPQMTADATIIEAQRSDVLLVPQMAVTVKKHRSFVNVWKDDGSGSTEERTVKVGITDDQNNEVLSGLSEGEKVLVPKDDNGKWAALGVVRPQSPGKKK